MAALIVCLFVITATPTLFVTSEGIQCGQPERPVNGTFAPAGRNYFPGEKVTYSCLEGFVLFGPEGRTCLKNGTWSGTVPLCDFNLAKGKRTLQSATLWSYVPGLAVDGNRNTCSFTPKESDTRWWQVHLGHKFNVVSIGVTISPGSFQEFTIYVIELLSDNKALYKPCTEFKGVFQTHKGLFKCNDGLGHPGQYVYVRDDRKEKQYFGLCEVEVFAFRERVPCGEPEVPTNGAVRREAEDRAVYSCDEGHKLEGDTTAICSSKGHWQGHTPKCSEVKCKAPPTLPNGFIEISNPRGDYVFGTEASYGCSPGFILRGAERRVCGPDGAWSENAPTCKEVSCGDPPTFANAEITFLNGSASQWTGIVVYNCLHGFKMLSGSENTITTCLDTGLWRPVNVSCVPFTDQLEFILRETEGRSLDFTLPKGRSETHDPPHLVITLAVIAGTLAAGMLVFGILLLRRRLLSSPLGSLSPLVIRVHEPHTDSKGEQQLQTDEVKAPNILAKKPSAHFHSNLLHSIAIDANRFDHMPAAANFGSISSAEEPPYDLVRSDHSYETLRKRRDQEICEEENETLAQDENYESVSSDKESVGYETVAGPKDFISAEPGYESIAGPQGEPGYEVLPDSSRDPGYEVVKERDEAGPGYETVRGEATSESGYEKVTGDPKRVHGYETLKPRLPPREFEKDKGGRVPDILQHLSEPMSPEDLIAGKALSDIPPEILALYAKVDKTKKKPKPKPQLTPASPPIPANHPILDSQTLNLTKPRSKLQEKAIQREVNSFRKTPRGSGPKKKAKDLIRKFNSLNSDEDTSDARSISPPSSLSSDGILHTGSLYGSLRPLPPLPK